MKLACHWLALFGVLLGCVACAGDASRTIPSADPDGDAAIDALVGRLEKLALYHPRKYEPKLMADFTAHGGQRLDYTTAQGQQAAWLLPPAAGGAPQKLWIVCPGNGTVALELAPVCRGAPFAHDACLLIDYPGYGACAGEPSPAGIRENLKAATLLAAKTLHLDPAELPARACVFGHSLGAAAALLAVQEFHLRRAVLCAPFTSTLEMAQRRLHTTRQLPLEHPFDNRVGLAALAHEHGHAWILHGSADMAIPATMGETLAREFPGCVTFKLLPGAGHNDFFRDGAKDLLAAITAARE